MNIDFDTFDVPKDQYEVLQDHVLQNALADYLRALKPAMETVHTIMEAVVEDEPISQLQWTVTERILFLVFEVQIGFEIKELLYTKVGDDMEDLVSQVLSLLTKNYRTAVREYEKVGLSSDKMLELLYRTLERENGKT